MAPSLFSSPIRPGSSSSSSTRFLLTLTGLALFRSTSAAISLVGCYSSSEPLASQGQYAYQSPSWCTNICTPENKAVFGLSDGSTCWCGNELPPAHTLVDSSLCDSSCDGYGQDMCGGINYYTVYLTGLQADVPNYKGNSSGTTSSESSESSKSGSSTEAPSTTSTPTSKPEIVHQPATVTQYHPGTTIIRTVGPDNAQATAPVTTSHKPSSKNVAPIAAGVSVGVVGLVAIVVGVYFLLRRRQRKQLEEDHRRQSQVADFFGNERKPPSTGYSQMSDSRLEPQASVRRNSVGSFADSQDYSRRILRVANPDGGP